MRNLFEYLQHGKFLAITIADTDTIPKNTVVEVVSVLFDPAVARVKKYEDGGKSSVVRISLSNLQGPIEATFKTIRPLPVHLKKNTDEEEYKYALLKKTIKGGVIYEPSLFLKWALRLDQNQWRLYIDEEGEILLGVSYTKKATRNKIVNKLQIQLLHTKFPKGNIKIGSSFTKPKYPGIKFYSLH